MSTFGNPDKIEEPIFTTAWEVIKVKDECKEIYEVGKDGITSIEEHLASPEDNRYYYLIMKEKTIIQVFGATCAVLKEIN